MENSMICNFYKNKNILITGATGFLGKLVLEKLLRVCKPKMIYLLIRTKKSIEPEKRLKDLTECLIFDRLKKEDPDFGNKIAIVPGDVSLPGLGLKDSDLAMLIKEVQIVLHGAATVKFDEKLALATKINVHGTQAIIELCHLMKNLLSVVCISTAFSHCVRKNIKEDFYDAPIFSDALIKLTECLKDHHLERVTPKIMAEWPNTYVFTKAVAEEAVRVYGKGLPIAVLRPAIILTTKSEPVAGWSDNLYGPQGLSLGSGVGIIRVIRCDPDCKADIVPADLAVNCLLAVGYNTSRSESNRGIPIYNFCTSSNNPIKWREYMNICTERAAEVPPSKGVWCCSCTLVKSQLAFFLLTFLLHTLPALFVDIGLLIAFREPRALKIYKKIHKVSALLSFFSTTDWNFSTENTQNLWKSLSESDKNLFNFDMTSLDFKSYLVDYVDGIRLYLVKEDQTTIPHGRRKRIILLAAHRLVQLVFFTFLGWCIWSLFILLTN